MVGVVEPEAVAARSKVEGEGEAAASNIVEGTGVVGRDGCEEADDWGAFGATGGKAAGSEREESLRDVGGGGE